MDRCSSCSEPLRDSLYEELEGQEYKSCPKCSADAGHHVFYRIEEFGDRDMGDGRHIVQSWCQACRSELKPSIPPSFTCE